MHVSGHGVGKAVVVEVGGRVWIAVLSACAWLDCWLEDYLRLERPQVASFAVRLDAQRPRAAVVRA